jgi:hypothetical protein
MRLFRKHRKLIKILGFLLVPVILYGSVKLAIWYSTQQSIKNLSKQFAGFLELNYQSISSSIKGSVSVNGLTVFIPMAKESIHIKKVRLSTDNVLTLLTLTSKFESQDIPNNLGFLIEGMRVDLNSKLLNTPEESPQTAFERLNTLACGDVLRFDEKVLKQMGYNEINADFNINYHYDSLAKTLQLNFYENVDKFLSLDLTAQIREVSKLPGVAEVSMNMANPQTIPKLGKIKLTLEDDSFITRKVNFCAKNNKSNQNDYIIKHVNMVDNYLQKMGIKLNQSLLGAYQKSLMHPGNIIVSMDFSDISNIMELSDYLPDDIIAQLGTEILVNNKIVSPISIQFDKQRFTKNTGDKAQQISIHDPNVKPKIIKKYHLVNKNNLKQYDRHPVKIKTTQGKTLKGRLSIKNPKKYEVISRTHGGEIGFFVKKAEIKSVEVFY